MDKQGGCWYGDRCGFDHSLQGEKDATPPSSSSPGTVTSVRVMTGGGQRQYPHTLAGVPFCEN
eukprot:5978774-Prorocentrum_lima.AAC.1